MAYPNNYYPNFYQPQMPMQMPMPMQQPVQQQIQDGGFMVIPNEDIVNTYPVAPGKCVTFKIEGKPIVIEKSMGFSQLESPKIERYRLVKEEPNLPHTEPQKETRLNNTTYVEKSDFEAVLKQIEDLKKEIAELKEGV